VSHIELIGVSGPELGDEQRRLIEGCVAVAVSRRYAPLVAGCPARPIPITPLDALFDQLNVALDQGDAAVLASGDPLFYGIGRSLIDRFGAERVRIHPAVSSMQLACARFGLPWDDLRLVSLHGRPADTLPGQVLPYPRVLLLTDQRNSPNRVAAALLAALHACDDRDRMAAIRMRVAENLGLTDERITTGSLEEIRGRHFGPLNLVLVEQPVRPCPCRFGLGEDEIRHSRGLITKDEVRAAVLHRLRLPATGVLWDIGGGSGSVSLEAARLCPQLSVYTVERNPAEQANIRANIRTYGAYTIHLVDGEAPAALTGLPDPDRVFVGGSGGQLEAILTAVAPRLRPGGRIVVSAVLEQSETIARQVLQQLCRSVTSATLAVTRHDPHGGPARVLNPITLITGEP
jgi:precorrin-6Y C5,15-methyltransferase (decarboxylating)